MGKEIYLIHLDDYLRHIDGKLEMYDLLLEMVRTLREDLTEGETARAVRDLCAYEQNAHILFECWTIPDEYVESGDPDDLARKMEKELLPADDGDEDDGDMSAAARLLRAVNGLTESTRAILNVASEIAEIEDEVQRVLDDYEGPENACAD